MMKKVINTLMIILAVAALALTGRAGYRFYRFSSNYAQVWNEEITVEEVEQLEAESRDAAAELAAAQRELDRLTVQLKRSRPVLRNRFVPVMRQGRRRSLPPGVW